MLPVVSVGSGKDARDYECEVVSLGGGGGGSDARAGEAHDVVHGRLVSLAQAAREGAPDLSGAVLLVSPPDGDAALGAFAAALRGAVKAGTVCVVLACGRPGVSADGEPAPGSIDRAAAERAALALAGAPPLGVPVVVLPVSAATRIERSTLDVEKWVRALVPGSRCDTVLPLTGRWARARVITVGPPPFRNWFRVAFEGLPLVWWRWVAWEDGPGSLRWGPAELAPPGWRTETEAGAPAPSLSEAEAAAALEAWRAGLGAGDRVNAMDSHHKWYEARVVSVGGAGGELLRVRFLGWSPRSQPNKYDEDVGRASHRLAPFTTKIRDWRRVQVRDDVEIREDRTVDNTIVVEVDAAARRVRVSDSAAWHEIDDVFTLACFGTHKRPRVWADVDRENPELPPPLPEPPRPAAGAGVFADAARGGADAGGGGGDAGALAELTGMGHSAAAAREALAAAEGNVSWAVYTLLARAPRNADAAGRAGGGGGSGGASSSGDAWDVLALGAEPPAASGGAQLEVTCRAFEGYAELSGSPRPAAEVLLPFSAPALSVTCWIRLEPAAAAHHEGAFPEALLLSQRPITAFLHPLPVGTLVEGRYVSLTWCVWPRAPLHLCIARMRAPTRLMSAHPKRFSRARWRR